jgi:hypothetical protein
MHGAILARRNILYIHAVHIYHNGNLGLGFYACDYLSYVIVIAEFPLAKIFGRKKPLGVFVSYLHIIYACSGKGLVHLPDEPIVKIVVIDEPSVSYRAIKYLNLLSEHSSSFNASLNNLGPNGYRVI